MRKPETLLPSITSRSPRPPLFFLGGGQEAPKSAAGRALAAQGCGPSCQTLPRPSIAHGRVGPGCPPRPRLQRAPPGAAHRARGRGARSAHVTGARTAEMERRGPEGGARRRRRRPRPGQTPSAPLPRPAGRRHPPGRPGTLTCVADDDVLEEVRVRHGRGRSVPGHTAPPPATAAPPPPRPSTCSRRASKRQARPSQPPPVAVSSRE